MTEAHRELAYNGSGYYDGTAYRAFMNLKEDKNMNAEGGDIWTVQKSDGTVREVLILATHDNYAIMLQLAEHETGANPVSVPGKSMMFADAGKISFVYLDYLLDFVKALPDEAFVQVMAAVIRALTIDMPEGSAAEIPGAVQEDERPQTAETGTALLKMNKYASAPGAAGTLSGKPEEEYRDMEIRLAQAEAERDIYKELFYRAFPQINGAA